MIISFDASSDVQTGAAIARVEEFGVERGYDIVAERDIPPLPPHPLDPSSAKDRKGNALRKRLSAQETEERFAGRFAQILNGRKQHAGVQSDGEPDLRILYCPLLPSAAQPEYDPAVSGVSPASSVGWA